MVVIKYKQDKEFPYVIEAEVRSDNALVGKQFLDKSEAKRVALTWGYKQEDIEFVTEEELQALLKANKEETESCIL